MGISLSSLDFLASRYPATLSVKQLSLITSESEQTIRNKLSCGSYPITSFLHGRKRLFRLIDVAQYLDQVCGLGGMVLVPRRGRPSKLEQLRRREMDAIPRTPGTGGKLEHAQVPGQGAGR